MVRKSRNQCGETGLSDRFDVFRTPVPNFSHNGKQHISSFPGLLCTAVIAVLVLIIAVDQILSFSDVLHKPEYRVIQKLYEPEHSSGRNNFTDLNIAVGL